MPKPNTDSATGGIHFVDSATIGIITTDSTTANAGTKDSTTAGGIIFQDSTTTSTGGTNKDSAAIAIDSTTANGGVIFQDSTTAGNGSNIIFKDSATTGILPPAQTEQEKQEKLQALIKLKEEKHQQLEALQADLEEAQLKGDVLRMITLQGNVTKITAEIKYLESVMDDLLHLEEIPEIDINQEIIESLAGMPEFVAKVHQTLLLTQDSHNAILYLLGFAKNGVDLITQSAQSVNEKYDEFKAFYTEASQEKEQEMQHNLQLKEEITNRHNSLNDSLINKEEILGKLEEAKEATKKLQDLLNDYDFVTNGGNGDSGISESDLNALINFANTSLGSQAKLSIELISVFERLEKLERRQ